MSQRDRMTELIDLANRISTSPVGLLEACADQATCDQMDAELEKMGRDLAADFEQICAIEDAYFERRLDFDRRLKELSAWRADIELRLTDIRRELFAAGRLTLRALDVEKRELQSLVLHEVEPESEAQAS